MLAAVLIVRDGALTVERAIASVRPHVDEVVVLDTGSTDGTLELLERLSAEPGAPVVVSRAEWTDYADARARSFALASQPWCMWLDDDEIVEGAASIRPMLGRFDDSVDHVYARTSVPDRLAGRVKLSWRIRIARRDRARWDGVVHEVLEPDDELAFAVASPNVLRVVHAPVDVAGRHDHTAELLEAIERPGVPPRLLAHAGQELINAGRLVEAIAVYRRYLELTAGEFSAMRLTALERLGTCLAHEDDVMAGIATMQALDTERATWSMQAAAGELAGLQQFGPDWLESLYCHSPKTGRNEPCPCGSGVKSKRCCDGARVTVTAPEIRRGRMAVAA